ncbi:MULTISPECIES: ferredoxin [unclassified Streptomyces]|uniref:ferredoxin n=1 Tax=unclassified Streptomyces TaxID=2593676 RepID=UPI00036195F8|nr:MULTISPECIES: ferredoxin [unclassified Streptomyces]MYY01867.1 ferredoxin [Streptomyces sp. SID4913]
MSASARIDRTLCLGTGLCESMAPDLFLLDDEGLAVPLPGDGGDERTELLRSIADCCPTGAITVTEKGPGAAARENAHESKG